MPVGRKIREAKSNDGGFHYTFQLYLAKESGSDGQTKALKNFAKRELLRSQFERFKFKLVHNGGVVLPLVE